MALLGSLYKDQPPQRPSGLLKRNEYHLNALRFGTNIPNEERNDSTRFSLSFL